MEKVDELGGDIVHDKGDKMEEDCLIIERPRILKGIRSFRLDSVDQRRDKVDPLRNSVALYQHAAYFISIHTSLFHL